MITAGNTFRLFPVLHCKEKYANYHIILVLYDLFIYLFIYWTYLYWVGQL